MLLFTTTQNVLFAILFLILAYLIGAIPFGLIFGLIFKHQDIRNYGSGNIGSTNTIRTFGLKIGIPVFICEVLKGAIIIILVKYVFDGKIFTNYVPLIFYGFAATMGHLFPIYIGFKGGKIVAPSLGILLVLSPMPAVACLIVFWFIVLNIGYVCLASCGAAITAVIVYWIQYATGYTAVSQGLEYLWGKPELVSCIMYTILGLVILIRHKANFKRLKEGTELKAKIRIKIEEKRKARKENKLNK
jgi:glycerol-3-phosphate acyltransferase PlsY